MRLLSKEKVRLGMDVLCKPVLKYPVYMLFLLFILLIPTIILYAKTPWKLIDLAYRWEYVPETLFVYGLGVFLILTEKFDSLHRCIVVVAHILVYALAIIDSGLTFIFGSHVNSYMFHLVEHTNKNEAVEFFSTYILNVLFLVPCFVVMVVGLLEYKALEKSDRIVMFLKKKRVKVILSLFIGFTFFFSVFGDVGESPVHNAVAAVTQYSLEKNDFNRLAKSQENIVVDSCSFRSENIVLIIGESHNRHHTGIYGYEKKTSPRLSQLDNLYVFDDVVSPVNSTAMSFQRFLSMYSADVDKQWYETTLFPCYFFVAGYNVIFWSNQFVKEIKMGHYDASCAFFYHPDIEKKLFNVHNEQKFMYDEQLIDSYKEQRSIVEKEKNNLIIFHLNGQHVAPKTKYPKDREFFKIEDYEERKELSVKMKQWVADYDNATLYNDSIVYEIISMFREKEAIVIYFSDHGDEVYDYRNHTGRSANFDRLGASALHCQLDIPFMIYVSDLYKEKHPDVVNRISKSTHRPFMTDDLPHLLFDLAGIDNGWYDPRRSLINDSFDIHRKRWVSDWCLTPLNYDSICSAYGDWKIGWISD